MYQSPRMRRLRNDLAALERLRAESSVFRFTSQGDPPQHYRIQFSGRGLWRDHGKVRILEKHHVEIKLGSSYPRAIPEIRWLTPVYHPNISEIGMVCLGGYGTHWVPSVQLDELCTMLWDMLRYHNYDIRSPYNRDAALWVAQQQQFRFPTDDRPLKDLRAALGRVAPPAAEASGRDGAKESKAEPSGRKGLGRVREFAQRYGRVFGTTPERSEPSHWEPADPAPARTEPSNPELYDLVAAQAGPAAPTPSADEPIFILDPEATDDAPPPTPAPETVDVAAEVRRLFARRDSARSPGDEIVFIE